MEALIDKFILNTKGVTTAYTHQVEVPVNQTWACEEADPELFFPLEQETLIAAQVVCLGCSARAVCLELGLSRSESGVWGGILLNEGKQIDEIAPRGRPRRAA